MTCGCLNFRWRKRSRANQNCIAVSGKGAGKSRKCNQKEILFIFFQTIIVFFCAAIYTIRLHYFHLGMPALQNCLRTYHIHLHLISLNFVYLLIPSLICSFNEAMLNRKYPTINFWSFWSFRCCIGGVLDPVSPVDHLNSAGLALAL